MQTDQLCHEYHLTISDLKYNLVRWHVAAHYSLNSLKRAYCILQYTVLKINARQYSIPSIAVILVVKGHLLCARCTIVMWAARQDLDGIWHMHCLMKRKAPRHHLSRSNCFFHIFKLTYTVDHISLLSILLST